MIKNTARPRTLSTSQMTKIGMLSAITIVLGVTNYGFIPLPMAKATIMHIPVIIGAILEGPVAGMLIGLIFGIFSLLQNMMSPTSILSPAFINPLVSILPRILIGVTSYYAYRLVSKKLGNALGIAMGTAVGSLTNTIGVLGMIYVTFINQYAVAKNYTISKAINALYVIGYTNGIAEAIVAVIIVVPVVMAVRRYKKIR